MLERMFDTATRERLAAAPPGVLDALLAPGDVAVYYASAQPGSEAVAALAAIDPSALPVSDRIDLLVALDRQAAWLSALQQQALAGLTPSSVASAPAESAMEKDPEWITDQVACALRLSARTAADKLRVAEALNSTLPGTRKLLAEGRISTLQAAAVADAVIVGSLDAAGAAQVEQRVLDRAPGQTLAELKRAVRRAVLAADPRTAAEQRAVAEQDRRVCVTPVDHGMAELWAYLPAEGAAAVMSAVNALARVTSAKTRAVSMRAGRTLWSIWRLARWTTRRPLEIRVLARRCRSRSRSARCSGWTRSRPILRATDRSPRR